MSRLSIVLVSLCAAVCLPTGKGSAAPTIAGCTYSVMPSSTSHGPQAEVGGFSVVTLASCSWSAQSNDAWIHTTSRSTGSGSVAYTVDSNPSPSHRDGTITVEGQIFTVGQSGNGCYATFEPATADFSSDAAAGSFAISVVTGCSWSAGSTFGWIHTSSSGQGSGTVQYNLDSFAGPGTRSGTIVVLERTFTIQQAAPIVKPAVLPIAPQTLVPGTPSEPIPLQLSAAFTNTSTLYITASSSNPTLLPDSGIFTGKIGQQWVMVLAPAVGHEGVAVVTMTVVDSAGLSAVGSFMVVVGTPPAPGFTAGASRLNSSGQFQTSLVAPNGPSVVIQVSSDLQNWADAAVLQNPAGELNYSDSAGTGFRCRFYRFKTP